MILRSGKEKGHWAVGMGANVDDVAKAEYYLLTVHRGVFGVGVLDLLEDFYTASVRIL